MDATNSWDAEEFSVNTVPASPGIEEHIVVSWVACVLCPCGPLALLRRGKGRRTPGDSAILRRLIGEPVAEDSGF